MKHDVYRDGRVHVLSEMCETCVFRPGNLMKLQSGRVRGMIDEARANESTIVCHATLYRDGVSNAVCRGFHDRYPTQPLQLAERLGLIEYDDPPPKESTDG
jgi:hypothetical protein